MLVKVTHVPDRIGDPSMQIISTPVITDDATVIELGEAVSMGHLSDQLQYSLPP